MRSTNPVIQTLGSLKVTITCLFLLMILVFVGTLAQVNLGIYEVQRQFFNSLLVMGSFKGYRFPVLPGGAVVGSVLIINLLIGIFFRLKWTVKSLGLLLIHWGLLILLVGGGLSSVLGTESQMVISENGSSNYSVNNKISELVIIRKDLPQTDIVTSIPESFLKDGEMISRADLPFKIKILKFLSNAQVQMSPFTDFDTTLPKANRDIGSMLFVKQLQRFSQDDIQNNTTVYVELLQKDHSLGVWLLSLPLGKPQQVSIGNHVYDLSIRPLRFYNPYSIKLKDFRHDVYPGTTIPKNFSSSIHINNPLKGESRDVDIYMNHPLRYEGKTYYQASYAQNDTVSIFQVVENPSWLTPYVSCLLMSLGFLIHFVSHLLAFLKRRRHA